MGTISIYQWLHECTKKLSKLMYLSKWTTHNINNNTSVHKKVIAMPIKQIFLLSTNGKHTKQILKLLFLCLHFVVQLR